MNIEIRHLRYFLVLADMGTFTRAAEYLNISQPGLSTQIRQLERELGTPLFDRVGRRIKITEAGELLLNYARKILLDLVEAKQAISELEGLVRGSVSIGVVQTINAFLIPRITSMFLAKYPGVALQVLELSAPEIEKGVEQGGLALGISFIPSQIESIEVERLFSEKLVVAVSKSNKLSKRKIISIESLKDIPLVTFPPTFFTRQLMDNLFEKAGVAPRIVLETNTMAGILTAVSHSDRVTILPTLALRLKEARDLCTLKIQNGEATRTLGFLWRRGFNKRKPALAFAELTRTSVQELSID
jgi:LysR family transcriptional regulator, cyn operon transcriptional activator